MLDKSLDKSFNSSFGPEHVIMEGTSESEDGIIINDEGDSLSGDSDDTSYSTWKQPPPPDKRTHRYLDEMRVSVNAVGRVLNVGLVSKGKLDRYMDDHLRRTASRNLLGYYSVTILLTLFHGQGCHSSGQMNFIFY